jgi:ribose 5-phosphate isomerase B
MKLFIGSDHAGFQLKSELVPFLTSIGFSVVDCGPATYVHDDDYPDYVSLVAKNVSKDPESIGIVIGRNGQGEAIVANRFRGVRCAVFYGGPLHVVTLAREHDDSNILSLGSFFMTTAEAKKAVEVWLHTKFSGDIRHIRRIKKIDSI